VPQIAEDLSFGSSGGDVAIVSVDCLGYYHYLDRYTYEDPINTNSDGFIALSTKLAAILDGDPNGLFSSGNADITTNEIEVGEGEEGDRTALTVIKDLITRGDDDDNRYIFGIFNGRQFVYEQVVDQITYQHEVTNPRQAVTTTDQVEVYPWNIVPGKWVLLSDLFTGRGEVTDLRSDPRTLFIDRVSFTAPWSVRLAGGKISTVGQRIARLGIRSSV
jgi:hypothetical protein